MYQRSIDKQERMSGKKTTSVSYKNRNITGKTRFNNHACIPFYFEESSSFKIAKTSFTAFSRNRFLVIE